MKAYNKNTLLLLAALFISMMGAGITQMYSLIYIYSLTNSNFYAALHSAVIFGSGVLGSHIFLKKKKKNLIKYMINSEFVCFFAVLCIVFAQNLALIYAVLITIYIADGFFRPAYQASLFRVSSQDNITKVNATSSMLQNIALAIGWLAAPLVFNTISYKGLFLFDAISYLFSACLILIVSLQTKKKSIFHENKKEEKEQNRRAPLYGLIIIILSITIVRASIEALEMGVFIRHYNLSNLFIGIFFTSWIVGGIFAALAIKTFKIDSFQSKKPLLIAGLIFTLSTYLFTYLTNKYIGSLTYTTCGFLFILINLFIDNHIYKTTPKHHHAHNFALKNITFNITMLTFIPILGLLADTISIPAAMLIAVTFSLLTLPLLVYKKRVPVKIDSK